MRVGIATDHDWIELKEDLKSYLRGVGHAAEEIRLRTGPCGQSREGISGQAISV
jgi:hypothetical protein